jgi:hypothetical protein
VYIQQEEENSVECKKYVVVKVGRKFVYVCPKEYADNSKYEYMWISFKKPDYTELYLEENCAYGRRRILFPTQSQKNEFIEERELKMWLSHIVLNERRQGKYTLDQLRKVKRVLTGADKNNDEKSLYVVRTRDNEFILCIRAANEENAIKEASKFTDDTSDIDWDSCDWIAEKCDNIDIIEG